MKEPPYRVDHPGFQSDAKSKIGSDLSGLVTAYGMDGCPTTTLVIDELIRRGERLRLDLSAHPKAEGGLPRVVVSLLGLLGTEIA